MYKLKAFTLAEVLITLAIIGVVAAISIPSVISNSQQQEFKTGLRKAVSVLNSAITMNMAIDGETPYENVDLFNYLQRHMSIMRTFTQLPWRSVYESWDGKQYYSGKNGAFYTTDGMRFEFFTGWAYHFVHYLYENPNVQLCTNVYTSNPTYPGCGGCGSYGLANNTSSTTKPPCLIAVDVNGDRKPTPGNINCTSHPCANQNKYIVPVPQSKKVNDIFLILITENRAFPYGVTAQKAMYEAQK